MNVAFLGDFNYPIQAVTSGKTIPPKVGAYTNRFTQWRVDDYGKEVVPGTNPPKKYEPHSVIDYAIFDQRMMNFTAVNTLSNLDNDGLRTMFLFFDHFPVAYDVTA